jgi:hypothetical protein
MPSEKNQDCFYEIIASIPDATMSKMFGAHSFKAPNGKVVGMLWQGNMVFKLPAELEQEVLSWDGTEQFSPMGDKKMGGGVSVPEHYQDRWKELAERAIEYVKTLR